MIVAPVLITVPIPAFYLWPQRSVRACDVVETAGLVDIDTGAEEEVKCCLVLGWWAWTWCRLMPLPLACYGCFCPSFGAYGRLWVTGCDLMSVLANSFLTTLKVKAFYGTVCLHSDACN